MVPMGGNFYTTLPPIELSELSEVSFLRWYITLDTSESEVEVSEVSNYHTAKIYYNLQCLKWHTNYLNNLNHVAFHI